MGNTLAAMVTKVSFEPDYAIWDRAQVVVLLSRTRRAKDIYFIGNPDETCDALLDALTRTSQYDKYIQHLLKQLIINKDDATADVEPFVPVIDTALHPFWPMDVPLPNDSTGVVYIAASLKDQTVTYIGETNDLAQRLKRHNSGYGSKQTSSHIHRPWALLAYVVGFSGSVSSRKAFESQWKTARLSHTNGLNADETANLAKQVISNRKRENSNEELRFVRTGTIYSNTTESTE